MGSVTFEVRGLSGTRVVTLDNENGDVTAGEIREAAEIAAGMVLRVNGSAVSDDELVSEGSVLVSTAPEAKHG